MYDRIITKKVLNEKTGEIKEEAFRLKKLSIKGGSSNMYKNFYDIIVEIASVSKTSAMLLKRLNEVMNTNKLDVNVSYRDFKDICGKKAYTMFIKRCIDLNYIKRTGNGVYRINPFILIPYKLNGAKAQREWLELENKNSENQQK